MIRQTSREAYWSLNDLGRRQLMVLSTIRSRGSACNLDIAEELGMPINSITPRTKELVDAGLVMERERRVITKTGRKVIFWSLTEEGKRIFERLI